jgi:hypothetical protein
MTYIQNVADTSRQASAVSFLESMQSKIELLMKAGDATDHNLKGKRRAIVKCPEEEKKFLNLAMKRRKQGFSWSNAAEGTPWQPQTLRLLAIRRGLCKPVNQKKLHLKHQEKFNAIARKVNAEARRIGNLRKALDQFPEITEDQYHAARARLSLPQITKQIRGARK